MRKSGRGSRKSGVPPAFDPSQFPDTAQGRVDRIRALIEDQRQKHGARVQKELAHHQDMMAKLDLELNKAWVALLEEARAEIPVDDESWEIESTPNGVLSNKGLRLTKISTAKAWDCNAKGTRGFTSGVHEWHVRLNAGGNGIGIGIAMAGVNPTDDSENTGLSYVLNCTSGSAYDCHGEKVPCFSNVDRKGLPINSLVSVHLDLDNHTLRFGLNGRWGADAFFSEIEEDEWFPFFTIGSQNKSVSIAPVNQFEEVRDSAEQEDAAAPEEEDVVAEEEAPREAAPEEEEVEAEAEEEDQEASDDGDGEWTLNPTPNGELSEDGRSLSKLTEEARWDTNTRGTHGWSRGVHVWHIKLPSGGSGVGLGIGLASIDPTNDQHNSNLTFVLNATSGSAYSQSGEKFACFDVAAGGLDPNSLVSIRLDMDECELSFGMNGHWNEGPTFTELPKEFGKWYPFFALGKQGISVELASQADFETFHKEFAVGDDAAAPEEEEEAEEEEEDVDQGDWTIEASPNGDLLMEGRELVKVTAEGWDCNSKGSQKWRTGVHEWFVRLPGGGKGVGLGICLQGINQTDDQQNSNLSFILNCTSGTAYDNTGQKFACFESGLPEGCVVGVRLDLDAHQLHFGLNGTWIDGPTFVDLPTEYGMYSPFFALGQEGVAVALGSAADFEMAGQAPPAEEEEEEEEAEAAAAAEEEEDVDIGDWTIEPTPNGQLAEDGRSVVKITPEEKWDSNTKGSQKWLTGVHEWYVRLLLGGTGVGLGICLQGIDKTDDQHNSNLSFILNCTSGTAYDNTGQKFACFESGLPEASVVALRLDLDARTLSFGLNGTWIDGPTFTELPSEYGSFSPFFALGSDGAAVSLVSEQDFADAALAAEEEGEDEADEEEEDVDNGDWTIEATVNGELSDDGLALIKASAGDAWDCNSKGSQKWLTGVHEWYVRLPGGGKGVGCGVCLQGIDQVDDSKNTNQTFLLNCTSGTAYNMGEKFACFETGLPEDCVLGLQLDLGDRTLRFGLNGTWIEGPTFVDLPSEYGAFSPFFALGQEGVLVELATKKDFDEAAFDDEEEEGDEEEAAVVSADVGEDEWTILETPNGVLANGNLTLSKASSHKGWDCDSRGQLGWTSGSGVHEWHVRLETEGNGVGIGICRGDINFEDDGENSNVSFMVNCGTGAAYADTGDKLEAFPAVSSTGLAAGTVVSVRLDTGDETCDEDDPFRVWFALHGEFKDLPTFTEVPADVWFPLFALGVEGKSVTVERDPQAIERPRPVSPRRAGAAAPAAAPRRPLPSVKKSLKMEKVEDGDSESPAVPKPAARAPLAKSGSLSKGRGRGAGRGAKGPVKRVTPKLPPK